MLKALVCVSCIFLLLLYFGEKSIDNCNLEAAGGGFSLGFHGSDLLGSHIAERQGDKETRRQEPLDCGDQQKRPPHLLTETNPGRPG